MARKTKTQVKPADMVAKLSRQLNIPKKNLYVVLTVAVVLALLYYFRGLFIVATVNGKPITRLEVVKELEKQSGQEVVESLISKNLILQEAQRKNVTVSEKETNAEMKKIEKTFSDQGQSFDQALKAQNLTRQELQERLRVELLVEKLVKDKVQVTEAEIDDFLRTNEATLPTNLSQEELRRGAKQQLESRELNQAAQKLLTELKQKANIRYVVSY